jgi:hypothetical protein
MNAVQTKHLVNAAEKAIAMLSDWSNSTGLAADKIAAELRSALTDARSPVRGLNAAATVRKPKGVKSYACYWGTPGDAWAYFATAIDYAAPWKPNMANQAAGYQKAEVTREKLSYCACGHAADAHHEDELNNLLECSGQGCDCTHFHYDSVALLEAA